MLTDKQYRLLTKYESIERMLSSDVSCYDKPVSSAQFMTWGFDESKVYGKKDSPRRIYALWDAGAELIKVGVSYDIGRRQREIERQLKHPLELLVFCPGIEEEEMTLHTLLGEYTSYPAVGGCEWYRPT